MSQQSEQNDPATDAPPPGMEDEELFLEYSRTRSAAIREELICRNLNLVPSLVRRFRESGESFEDLSQVGYIGLIKAVDGFNPQREVKFSTYATHCITGEIRHHLRDRIDSIKRPRWLQDLTRKLASYIDEFVQKDGHLPSIENLSQYLNIAPDGVVELLKSRTTVSLESLGEQSSEALAYHKIRRLRYESFRLPIEDRIVLTQAVEALKKVEQRIIYLFFYMDLTQTQIATDLGLSQKKVSRILRRALDRLNEALRGELQ